MKRLTALLLLAGALLAHHSWPGAYDLSTQLILKGRLTKLAFKNPHVILTIETKGSGEWLAECTSADGMLRRGITEETFKLGDTFEIVGSPSRDPGKRVVAAIWEIRRPADGMRWVQQEWTGPRVIE